MSNPSNRKARTRSIRCVLFLFLLRRLDYDIIKIKRYVVLVEAGKHVVY